MLIMNIYSGVQYDRMLFRIAHTVQVMQGTSKNFQFDSPPDNVGPDQVGKLD